MARGLACSMALCCGWLIACSGDDATIRAGMSLQQAMSGGDTTGFARAVQPRAFSFPADHGPHPEFRIEWWYVTGNVRTIEGRRYGFQLTFFRSAQAPPGGPERGSAWAANDVWMAHFAVVDQESRRFHHFERFARGAAGLAGAQASPFRVWVEDWSIESMGADGQAAATFPVRLRAAAGEVALDLVLNSERAPVLQGDAGLSAKGAEPGNASYYYSITRLPARGRVSIDGDDAEVTGAAWLDREWSTSALGADLVGWDWFALQLDDGHDLMLYQLRRADGSADRFSAGTLIDPEGVVRRLANDEFALEPLEWWESPAGEARYPVRWRARAPAEGLDLTVEAILPQQELTTTVRYWEGAVNVAGRLRGQPARGNGYLEMTGYADLPEEKQRTRAPRRGW